MWNLRDIIPEESCIRQDSVVRQGLDTSARRERGTRLVKGDVAIFADTAEEELDAAVRGDLLLIFLALFDQILSVSIQNVDMGRINIDWID
jgi:hypothetical protein